MKQQIIKYLQKNQVITALLFVLLLWFLLQIRDIVLIFFISFIIMATFHPIVEWLATHHIPRIIAVFIVYIVTLLLFILLVFPLVPFFSDQLQQLIKHFPGYLQKTGTTFGINIRANYISGYTTSHLEAIGANALFVTTKFFGGLFSVLAMIVISFYLLLSHNRMKDEFIGRFSKSKQNHMLSTIDQVENKLGAWLRGQVLLSVTIGILVWIALMILRVPFALPLALMAGLFEIIPTIGPILAAIPALIVGFSVSPLMVLFVAIAYAIVQLLENNVIVPKIMESAVGLNPIVIILSVMIGGQLLGLTGALLSIPFVTFLIVIFRNL